MDESYRPVGLLVTDSTVLAHTSTNSGLAKSCAHTAAAAVPSGETPKLIEVPGAWTQCSVWDSTRSTQAEPSLRTTAVQTEDEAIGTGQKK